MLIYVTICCLNLSLPVLRVILPENSNIDDQNLNSLNPWKKETDYFTELKPFRFKKPKMGQLIINSLTNKLESIKSIIIPYIDILLVSKTNLDESINLKQSIFYKQLQDVQTR